LDFSYQQELDTKSLLPPRRHRQILFENGTMISFIINYYVVGSFVQNPPEELRKKGEVCVHPCGPTIPTLANVALMMPLHGA